MRYAVLVALALSACVAPPEPGPEQVAEDVDLILRVTCCTLDCGMSPDEESAWARIEAHPAPYLEAVAARVRHPSAPEQFGTYSTGDYFRLLEIAEHASETEARRLAREGADIVVPTYLALQDEVAERPIEDIEAFSAKMRLLVGMASVLGRYADTLGRLGDPYLVSFLTSRPLDVLTTQTRDQYLESLDLEVPDLFCGRHRATIYVSGGQVVGGPLDGEPYRGRLIGTSSTDIIVGTEQDDLIVSGDGEDYLCGLGGDDVIDGGGGNDNLRGGPGRDLLLGGDGDDTLISHEGSDRLRGGAGSDYLVGLEGEDFLEGSSGDDRLTGGPGSDRLSGGPGDDWVVGSIDGPGAVDDAGDTLEGGDGDDRLDGGLGVDTAYGGRGYDRCRAEQEEGCEEAIPRRKSVDYNLPP